MKTNGKAILVSAFSIPIMKIENGLVLPKKDIKYLESLPIREGKEGLKAGNVATSKNMFLLQTDKRLEVVKNHMDTYVTDYLNKTLCVDNDFEMTNSWVARTKTEHHQHNHKSAIVSVVYYASADDSTICFVRDHNWLTTAYDFDLQIKEYNQYNSTILDFDVKTGDFMIFPGWLTHKATNNSDSVKTIIGANYFIKGEVGSDWNTTSLKV